jgi:hypothetical protein
METRGARVVFLKTGWMAEYRGADEAAGIRPLGGGEYNEKNIGFEECNFLPDEGRVYGYAHIGSKNGGLRLKQIDHATAKWEELPGVLVIWVAPLEGTGEPVVVGWYQNATVLAARADPPEGRPRGNCGWIAHAAEGDAVLLPSAARPNWAIPKRGSGGFGQRNVLYGRDDGGRERDAPWLRKLLGDIGSYKGGSVVGVVRAGDVPTASLRGGARTPVGRAPEDWVALNSEDYYAETPAARAWRSKKENRFVEWFAAYLSAHGAKPRRRYPVDLLIEDPVRVIFEAKQSAGRLLVRDAVGQLLFYSFLFRAERCSELCVAVPAAPSDEVIEFVEDHAGRLIVWREGERLIGGPKTSAALSLLGVSPSGNGQTQ